MTCLILLGISTLVDLEKWGVDMRTARLFLNRTSATSVQEESLNISNSAVECVVDQPCEYEEEVDFRVMVITYNRPKSLETCLSFLEHVDTMGDTMQVEIWIDRSSKGKVSNETVKVAETFIRRWNKHQRGRGCTQHIREKNAGIIGQWTDTWRPKLGSKEIGLILEDDVDVAPMAYRWLKAAHAKYDDREDINGYTLQMQNVNFFGGTYRPMSAPNNETVYMYSVLGTWGFSPHPKRWRDFQDWSHDVRPKGDVKPYVPGIKPTKWYIKFEYRHSESSMWEMWHIYFSYISDLFCVYCNLKAHTGKEDVLLSWNRKEKGLHYNGKSTVKSTSNLLLRWNASYGKFPEKTIQFFYNGTIHRRV